MKVQRLGRCGLKVSQFSLGVASFGQGALTEAGAREAMAIAFDGGVNYFDNAESYNDGEAERVMGRVLKQLSWPRLRYIVSTKFYWGISRSPNEKNTLNRKYLIEAMDASLQRLQMDHVDIVYCHRSDPHTPLEETVWALHNLIERGKALYWGTSEWAAQDIRTACEIAERHHLHKPVVEQPEYSLLDRGRVETEYPVICAERGIGLATWSPLCGGALTGKYLDGVPKGSRADLSKEVMPSMAQALADTQRNDVVRRLLPIAQDLGCPLAHLALAWCTLNPNVSTVILGCSRPSQVSDNLRALDAIRLLTQEVRQRIDAAVGDYSASWVGGSPWHFD